MRILVIHPGALGDLILALPALAALRESYPDSKIVGFTRSPVWRYADFRFKRMGIARYAPAKIEWRDLERSGIHRLFSSPAPEVLGPPRRADIVISWMGEGDHTFLDNIARSTDAEVIAMSPRPPEGQSAHVSRYLINCLSSLKIEPEKAFVLLASSPEEDQKANRALKELGIEEISSLLMVHPGSGARAKCWPQAFFAEIALKWRDEGKPVVLLEGPADSKFGDTMRNRVPKFPKLKDAPIGELISLMSRCAAYLGNDSGITHLAAGAGAPAVAIFGPTDARVWAPLGPHVRVISSSAECAPCPRSLWSDCHKGACMNTITESEVARAVGLKSSGYGNYS